MLRAARYGFGVGPESQASAGLEDDNVDRVAAVLLSLDPGGSRVASVMRSTYDQVYDGRRTGRFRWSELAKVEKTYFGSLVEINLQREFAFDDGDHLDFSIDGVEVDCKWSQRDGEWMIPPEAIGRICMLVHADDETSEWKLGLLTVDQSQLRAGANRDGKRTLSAEGRQTIRWIWESCFAENILLRMTPDMERGVLAPKSGTERLNALFRAFLGEVISRNVIETVARQHDALKRLRYNGGSRSALQPEGIVILGGSSRVHRNLAVELGANVPGPSEFVAVRLVPSWEGVTIDDRSWRIARPHDPVGPAPTLPNRERA